MRVALARAAARGSGLPVTVKLRSGQRPGDLRGIEVARRLAVEGAVAGIAIHPRHASQRHKGGPTTRWRARLVEELPVPVLISGGLHTAAAGADGVRADRRRRRCCWRGARWATRGCSASCWGGGPGAPDRGRGAGRARLGDASAPWRTSGEERAARYLRKFYPWYLERLGGGKALRQALQTAPTLEAARALLHAAARRLAAGRLRRSQDCLGGVYTHPPA